MDRSENRIPLARSRHHQQLVVFFDRRNADIGLLAVCGSARRAACARGTEVRCCPGTRLILRELLRVLATGLHTRSSAGIAGIELADADRFESRRNPGGGAALTDLSRIDRVEM